MAGAAALTPVIQPKDWPRDGAIDLGIHDLPHASASTEWWYFNAHLQTSAGREFALFGSFFRVIKALDEQTKAPLYSHSMTWALSDLQAKSYHHESRVEKDAPKLGLERVKRGDGTSDSRIRRAMQEMLERDSLPHPDRIFKTDPVVALDKLDLDLGGNTFVKGDDGSYRISLWHERDEIRCDLTLRLQKDPVRHGDNGIVKGIDGSDMFYYFVPRCEVSGTITHRDEEHAVSGEGWYDHEFGGRRADEEIPDKLPEEKTAWNWLALQLGDGSELTAYNMVDSSSGAHLDGRALIISPEGTRREYRQVRIEPLNEWRSTRTFNAYPTRWRLTIPKAEIDFEVAASFDDQEFITLISKPAFWEGRVDASGRRGAAEISGRGYFERSGFLVLDTLDDFFSAVGQEVRKSVREVIPLEPSFERVRDLIASEERQHLMNGVSIDAFTKSMIEPVREITDRGGKSWRSYAALACCDVVGGDSRLYTDWLAMPEFLHVGSLIVDDVEDQSAVRRGGPTCHVLYGEPIAINSGTACYFLGHKLLKNRNLNDQEKLRVYDLYFEALRAGHSGQALDIYGLDEAMEAAVESGNGAALEAGVLAIHRLKTAAPAAALARMGAVAGRGSEEQIEALGTFFESVGTSFQIIDDVLNLRGFKGELKTRGEDIMRGIVTLPVAKAVSRLPKARCRDMWETIKTRPDDQNVVNQIIDDLEGCAAIEDCATEAHALVESAWARLNPLIEDSLPKLMLRAFGWYVLERQY